MESGVAKKIYFCDIADRTRASPGTKTGEGPIFLRPQRKLGPRKPVPPGGGLGGGAIHSLVDLTNPSFYKTNIKQS